jgi:chromosome segregation ATPase
MHWMVVNLRATFAVFVVLGAAFIFWLTKVAEHQPGSAAHWVLVSAVLGLMVIFGVIVWARSRTGQAADTDGETFYYLGFIYTLLTLVATFTPLLSATAKPSTQQVLGLFGLGLITTFLGLAGRVFFLQSRSGETIESNADRLNRAYAEAARILEATALQVSRVGTDLERATTKAHQLMLDSIDKATRHSTEQSAKLFDDTSKRITSLASTTANHLDQSLRTTADGLTNTLKEFGKSLASLKLPAPELGERLTKRIEALTSTAQDATNATSAFLDQLKQVNAQLKDLTPGVLATNNGLTTLGNTATAASKSLVNLSPAIDVAAAAANSLEGAFSTARNAGSDFGGTMEKLALEAGNAAPALSQLASHVESAAPALTKLAVDIGAAGEGYGKLVTLLASAEDSTKNLSQVQKSNADELARVTQTLKVHHDTVHKLALEMQENIRLSEEAVRKVHSNLVAATDFITTRIQ